MEPKAAIMARLKAAALWGEASEYRREVRESLRANGRTRKQARLEAWVLMAAKYPKLDDDGESFSVTADDRRFLSGAEIAAYLEEHGDQSDVDFVRDILWAYGNLSDTVVSLSDAPSLGAFNLLMYAQSATHRFFAYVLPRALDRPQQANDPSDRLADRSDDGKPIPNFMRGFEEQYGEGACELEKLQADRKKFWEARNNSQGMDGVKND
jgi:hypothetical protein